MSGYDNQIGRESTYIGHHVREGLTADYEDAAPDQRMVGFALVVVWNHADEDGNTHETYSVYSDSKNQYSKIGMLACGQDRLRGEYYGED